MAVSQPARASVECRLEITRKACDNKKEEALFPYNGQEVTHEIARVDSKDSCLAMAKRIVIIVRKDKLREKSVRVWVNGEQLWQEFMDRSSCRGS